MEGNDVEGEKENLKVEKRRIRSSFSIQFIFSFGILKDRIELVKWQIAFLQL